MSCAHFQFCREDITNNGSNGKILKKKDKDWAGVARVCAKLTGVDRAEDDTLQKFEIDDLGTAEQRFLLCQVKDGLKAILIT